MRFADILSRVKSLSNVTSQDALLKDAIRAGLDIATSEDLPYLMTDGYIVTVAPYETGTVSITNGSKTVTGSGTTFTSAMVGRKIRFSDENAYYRIASFTSTTEITLETDYQGTTDTDATYSIFKDEYRLPPDCDGYYIMRQVEDARALTGISPSAFDILEPSPISEGSPRYELLVGSKLDTYTTGTVSGTINTSTITGSGTAWTSVEGLAKGSHITIGDYVYTVKSVDSATQITIYEDLIVAVSAGTTYSISLDNFVVQFFDIPDEAENIYFRYRRIPAPLYNDNDIPDLPDKWHYPLLVTAGLIAAYGTKDREESIRQEQLFSARLSAFWQKNINISKNTVYAKKEISVHELHFPYSSRFGLPISR